MKKTHLILCAAALTLIMTGAIAQAADLLKPNTPSLTATAPAPAAAPATTGLAPKPATTLMLNNTQTESSIDPKDIPDIVMKEMQEVENNCTSNYFYSSFHDCKCVAVKFLDARMKSNPDTSKETIFNQVANQCVDEASIAGYVYKSCADYMQHTRPSDYISFCRCSANATARSYKRAPMMNLRYVEGLRRKAFTECGIGNNPDIPSSGGSSN